MYIMSIRNLGVDSEINLKTQLLSLEGDHWRHMLTQQSPQKPTKTVPGAILTYIMHKEIPPLTP